ncbi:hypothetical protein [Natronobacterium gregoryi]|nr:hypothetical protein [Natronobacterium gregoryi]
MEFAVSRDGTTLVTLHEGSDTTAKDEAQTELETTLEELAADGSITDWTVVDAEVYEPPTAPFDPYTISVSFTATVTVEADGERRAVEAGAAEIDEALEDAGVEPVSYTASPTAAAV